MAQILSIQSHLNAMSDLQSDILNNHNGYVGQDHVVLPMEFKEGKVGINGSISSTPSLQRTAVDIEWKNISYSVSLGRKKGMFFN